MNDIDLKILLEAGAHFGHKTNKWNPSAKKFIYKAVGDIHIIDLTITKDYLERARTAVREWGSQGRTLLFVGTKRQAAPIVKKHAEAINAPYINTRWIGGFITNWQEVKKNLKKLNKLNADLKDGSTLKEYTKRERMLMDRDRGKLEMIYGGVANMTKQPDMIYVVDTKKEQTVINEALQYDIPIVGIVDTNSNPEYVTYPIPANDDAVGSIDYITQLIAEAYKEGREAYNTQREKEQKAKEEEKAKAKKQ